MKHQLLALISICFLTTLAISGSDKTSVDSDKTKEPSLIPDFYAEPDQADPCLVLIKPSQGQDKPRFYHVKGKLKVFNLYGIKTRQPLMVMDLIEYRFGENRRGIIVKMTPETSIIFVYEDFLDGKKEFLLTDRDPNTEGWLSRISTKQDNKDLIRAKRDFLVKPKAFENFYKLKGKISLTITDGLVSAIKFKKLETINPIQPNDKSIDSALNDRIANVPTIVDVDHEKIAKAIGTWLTAANFEQGDGGIARAVKMQQILKKNITEGEEMLQFIGAEVKERKRLLESIEELIDPKNFLPASFTNVEISVKPYRKRKLFDITLLP